MRPTALRAEWIGRAVSEVIERHTWRPPNKLRVSRDVVRQGQLTAEGFAFARAVARGRFEWVAYEAAIYELELQHEQPVDDSTWHPFRQFQRRMQRRRIARPLSLAQAAKMIERMQADAESVVGELRNRLREHDLACRRQAFPTFLSLIEHAEIVTATRIMMETQ
jgi:hypothetical protein